MLRLIPGVGSKPVTARGLVLRRRRSRMQHAPVATVRDPRRRSASPLVEPSWLNSKCPALTIPPGTICRMSLYRLATPGTKILDASWYLPTFNRQPVEEYKRGHIPGAQFFDINTVADTRTDLPHMLPTTEQFAAAADALGIEPSDHVIVYDGAGIFSSARAWWMFKAFGHKAVSVLDGGFSAWTKAGFDVESRPAMSEEEILVATRACRNLKNGSPKYPAVLDKTQVRDLEMMSALSDSRAEQVLDARPSARFTGKMPEPRPGIRPGHIPGSLNVPFKELLTADGRIKSETELMRVFSEAGVDISKNTVVTCGSGVTACVIALALDALGSDIKVALYDGAFAEWGARDDTPVDADEQPDV